MKKVLIISISFFLFFAVLAYFIWQQYRENRDIMRPANIPLSTGQPLPPAPPDTAKVTGPDFNFARLKGDSLHLYSLPFKSDTTLETALYKDELDKDRIELIAKKGDWYQNEDSLWFRKEEVIPFHGKETP